MKPEDRRRHAFEKFRDQRNALLEHAGHKPGSKFHVTNTHYTVWEAALAHRDAQPAVAQGEVAGYQFRTRLVHHTERGWSAWEPCDKKLFDACRKIPVLNGTEQQAREVYAEAPAVAVNELTAALDEYDITVLHELAATLEFRSPSRYKALAKVIAAIAAAEAQNKEQTK